MKKDVLNQRALNSSSMSYSVIPIPLFEKEAKRLAKKYPSLKKDLTTLVQSLKENPQQGIPLGGGCYKIRLAISSKQQGKSGGARVITVVRIISSKIFLATIFDKSEKENVSAKELKEIIKQIPSAP